MGKAMPHVIRHLVVAALLPGWSEVKADTLFYNGPPTTDTIGLLNSGPFTAYDNFSLSSPSIIQGVTWMEHDTNLPATQADYRSTDIFIFANDPLIGSAILAGSFVATRTPNTSPLVFGTIGFDAKVTFPLPVTLPAGTYSIGIHNDFAGSEQSSWDLSAGDMSSIPGRYVVEPVKFVPSWVTPDLIQGDNALVFRSNEDSVFQILGTSVGDSSSDPSPVPAPSTLAASSILLGTIGACRVGRHLIRLSPRRVRPNLRGTQRKKLLGVRTAGNGHVDNGPGMAAQI